MLSITLAIGFILWYLYYGLECYINSGSIGRNEYLMPFQCFWEELTWVLPGGYLRKVQYLIDRDISVCEMDEFLPGRIHFVCTHILLPSVPTIVYLGYLAL